MNHEFKAGLVLSVLELIADSALKQSNIENNQIYKIIGYGGYLFLAYGLDDYYNHGFYLGRTNSYWDATSEIITALTAHYIYNEEYKTSDIIGTLLISGGIYLLNKNPIGESI